MRKQTILERKTEVFKANKTYGDGWIEGPYTDGQASFRRGSNSRGVIQHRLGDKCMNPNRTDIVIITGAKRWRAAERTKNRILYRPTPIGKLAEWLIY